MHGYLVYLSKNFLSKLVQYISICSMSHSKKIVPFVAHLLLISIRIRSLIIT